MADLNDHYRALASRPGFVDRSDRVRIEVSGADRAKFLHNLTTNDVKRLAVGRGHESFVTSLQGKTLGYLTLIAAEDRILLRTDGGGATLMMPHLAKYGVFDDVSIDDISDRSFEFHLVGTNAEALLRQSGVQLPPEGELSHGLSQLAGSSVRVVRESPMARPGFTLIGRKEDAANVEASIRTLGESAGLMTIDRDLFNILRIEAGTPVFGEDLGADNLPQEIGRDDRAISFVKGCYLGQETVARIDALGHVNKMLKGFRFLTPDAVAAENAGAKLLHDGKVVGQLTSTAFSPGWGATVALGYVRANHAAAGTELLCQADGGSWNLIVCDLPMQPSADDGSPPDR